MSLGLIKEYNREWPEWFERIKKNISENLQDEYIAIEHVGSTSVEGMNAKPIIDIDIIINKDDFMSVKSNLEKIGYLHQGDLGIKGREVFQLLAENVLPEHHLYVCDKGEHELKKHLAFRDYLRRNEAEKQKLIELKRNLEEICKTRQEYIDKKSDLVQEITKKALNEYELE